MVNTQDTPKTASTRAAWTPRKHVLLVVMTGAVLGLFVACSSLRQAIVIPPEIPGATFVGSDQCAVCHEDAVKKFQFSVHARLDVPGGQEGKSGCEACHGPGSKHIEAMSAHLDHPGMVKDRFIQNPGKHPETCMRCHMDKQAQFSMAYTHPVLAGKMSCNDCHDPHGDIMKPAGVTLARTNDTCMQCHKEQAAVHIYEHEALRDGCITCHAVHGSPNKKMLTENNVNLCLKCHGQIQASLAANRPGGTIQIGSGTATGANGHATRINHATCWASGCHDAVHGSNLNSHLRY